MKVELVLFIVLGSVFIVDFVLKGLKRPSKQKDGITSFKESSNNNKASGMSNKYSQYLFERPRNIGLYFFSVTVLKILIHYLAYPDSKKEVIEPGRLWRAGSNGYVEVDQPFFYYVEKLFLYDPENPSEFVFIWIISIAFVSFIVWQLNPYIKKR